MYISYILKNNTSFILFELEITLGQNYITKSYKFVSPHVMIIECLSIINYIVTISF